MSSGRRKSGFARVLVHEQRVVRLAEEAGVLAGRDRAVGDDVRERDERGDALRGRGELVDDAAVGGEEVDASRGGAGRRSAGRRR